MFRIICEDQATRQSNVNQTIVAQQEKCAGVCYRVPKPFINPSNYFLKKAESNYTSIKRASRIWRHKIQICFATTCKGNCRNVYPRKQIYMINIF